jgi:hypothetical protein
LNEIGFNLEMKILRNILWKLNKIISKNQIKLINNIKINIYNKLNKVIFGRLIDIKQ